MTLHNNTLCMYNITHDSKMYSRLYWCKLMIIHHHLKSKDRKLLVTGTIWFKKETIPQKVS